MEQLDYRAMMKRINNEVNDIRLHGLWMMLGEKINIVTRPGQRALDTAMFEQLFLSDPGAAPVLRETVDFFPGSKKIDFLFSEAEPLPIVDENRMVDPTDFSVDESNFRFRFYRDETPDRTMRIHFWKSA